MNMETIFTSVIPAIMIFFLAFFNIRKMQKRAQIMRMEKEGKCGSGCSSCAHSKGCSSEKKTENK